MRLLAIRKHLAVCDRRLNEMAASGWWYWSPKCRRKGAKTSKITRGSLARQSAAALTKISQNPKPTLGISPLKPVLYTTNVTKPWRHPNPEPNPHEFTPQFRPEKGDRHLKRRTQLYNWWNWALDVFHQKGRTRKRGQALKKKNSAL